MTWMGQYIAILSSILYKNSQSMQPNISLQQFARLPLLSKASWAYFEGSYLGVSCSHGGYKVALYALHDFYVELWYLKKNGQLKEIRSFRNYKMLDPFLKNIDITPILKLLAS